MSFSKELNSEDVFNAIDGRNVYENGELRAVDMTSCTTNPEGFRGRLMELTAFHPGPGHENDEPVPFTLFVVEDGIKRQYIPHDEAGTTFLTNFLEDATKDDFDMATPIETFVEMGTSVYFVGMKPRKRLHGIIETVKRRNADRKELNKVKEELEGLKDDVEGLKADRKEDRKELNKVKDDVDELKDRVADDDEFRLKTARKIASMENKQAEMVELLESSLNLAERRFNPMVTPLKDRQRLAVTPLNHHSMPSQRITTVNLAKQPPQKPASTVMNLAAYRFPETPKSGMTNFADDSCAIAHAIANSRPPKSINGVPVNALIEKPKKQKAVDLTSEEKETIVNFLDNPDIYNEPLVMKATGVQESLTDEQSKSIETLVNALDKLPKSKSPSYVVTTMDTEWIKMVVNKIHSDGRYHHIFPTFISSTKTRYINTSNMNVLFSIAGETGKDVSLFK
uniref:Uncharacterized protein n=1 Tax=Amphora coffeiformis TaxID=265554 RepID=A0A7S3KVC3_9STRA